MAWGLVLQRAFGLDALSSGLITFAGALGALAVKPLARGFLRGFGFRRLLIVNGIITAGSMALCALLSPGTAILLIILILFSHGASRSMQFTCMTTLAYTEIPHTRMSRANGFLSAVMQLSIGMGVVALGPVLDSLGLPPDAGAATSGHRLGAVPAAIGVAE